MYLNESSLLFFFFSFLTKCLQPQVNIKKKKEIALCSFFLVLFSFSFLITLSMKSTGNWLNHIVDFI